MADARLLELAPGRRVRTRLAGLFLFLPLLARLGWPQLVGRAGYPGVYSRLGEGRVRAFADSLVPLRVAPVRVAEGGTARFTLTLGRPSTLPVSVGWATVGQTATAGADFTAGRGVAEFSPGETAATVDVPVTADTAAERDETFRLRLSVPVNTWLAAGSAVATIADSG